MTEFGDVAFAAKLRDITRTIARSEIDAAIPPDQFGTVTDVDEAAKRAYVVMPGSPDPQSVGYGFGVPPDTGTTVRITGRRGSRYIAGSGGGTGTTDAPVEVVDGVGISDLDVASALDGSELVPIVQGGVTVRTTTQDIADLVVATGSGFPVGPASDAGSTYEISLETSGGNRAQFRAISIADPTQFAELYLQPNNAVLVAHDGTERAAVVASASAASLSADFDNVSPSGVGSEVFAEVFTTLGSPFTTDGPRRASHGVLTASSGVGGTEVRAWAVGDVGDANLDAGVTFIAPLYMQAVGALGPPRFPDDLDNIGNAAIYVFDNAGSMELRVKFENGTVVTLATD